MASTVRKIYLVGISEFERRFARDLYNKQMPDYFLYVGDCGENWLKLQQSDAFAVSHKLTGLLKANINDLSNSLDNHNLLSIGVGSGEKEAVILEKLSKSSPCQYVCVDINDAFLNMAADIIQKLHIETVCVLAMLEQLTQIKAYCRSPLVLALLGNNFCNYHPIKLLELIYKNLGHGDLFLFDSALLSEDKANTTDAYNCELNRIFNMAPLFTKGLSPQDCSFELKLIKERIKNMELYRTKKQIIIHKDCRFEIGSTQINFNRDDKIQMGFTFKYKPEQIFELLKICNFKVIKSYFDSEKENMLVLAQIKAG